MTIYFARAVGTEFVKIGHTHGDASNRLGNAGTFCPYELVLEAVALGSRDDETMLHELLGKGSDSKGRHERGEWFRLSRKEVEVLSGEIVRPPSGKKPILRFKSEWSLQRRAVANAALDLAKEIAAKGDVAGIEASEVEGLAWKCFEKMNRAVERLGPGALYYCKEAHDRHVAAWERRSAAAGRGDKDLRLPDFSYARELGKTTQPTEGAVVEFEGPEQTFSSQTSGEAQSDELIAALEEIVGDKLFRF